MVTILHNFLDKSSNSSSFKQLKNEYVSLFSPFPLSLLVDNILMFIILAVQELILYCKRSEHTVQHLSDVSLHLFLSHHITVVLTLRKPSRCVTIIIIYRVCQISGDCSLS